MANRSGLFITGQWRQYHARLMPFANMAMETKKDIASRVADVALKIFRTKIRQGGDPSHPLAPATISLRAHGGTTPLNDTGKMLAAAAVSFDYEGVTLYYDDPEVASYASPNEYGAHVKVTPAMRAYLAAQGMPLKKTTTVIVVPPRPVLGPATEDTLDVAVDIIEDELEKLFVRAGLGT
jgi:hypothetical protein